MIGRNFSVKTKINFWTQYRKFLTVTEKC